MKNLKNVDDKSIFYAEKSYQIAEMQHTDFYMYQLIW